MEYQEQSLLEYTFYRRDVGPGAFTSQPSSKKESYVLDHLSILLHVFRPYRPYAQYSGVLLLILLIILSVKWRKELLCGLGVRQGGR